jgi:hypothetical protein
MGRGVEIYGMFKPSIFSRLDIIEIRKFRNTTFSDLDMSQDDIGSRFIGNQSALGLDFALSSLAWRAWILIP